VATDVLRERLGRMMYRKTKDEVLQLPEKSEETLYIKIPNAEQYTVTHVKSAAMQFVTDRRTYHMMQMPKYKVSFDAALAYAEQHIANKSQFAVYKDHTNYMRKHVVSTRNPHDVEIIKWCNAYEKATLIPILPDKLRKEFIAVKAAVKYLHMKIQGEVIGQFLMRLRIKMTSDLVAHSGLTEIIENATKKTVIFTSYVDTIEVTSAYLKKHGYTPVLVYGETAGELVAAVEQFTKNPKVNPLIASIQMLATGVTLVTANTMVFLNVPWRWTDKDQAEARIHRLGQDTPVMIYTIILDTGAEANLSSRMDEIISWSKDMFDQLVGSA
jgi:SNF2 family DNA or RNA helicase